MPLIDNLSAVVFDVGAVLYNWDIRPLYAKLIDDPARLNWFCANVVTPEWHLQHDAGRPYAETTAELAALYPDQRDLINAYAPRWLETITGPVPGMLALVEDIAAHGTPLNAITNFSAEFWAMFRPTAPIFDHFRDIVVSGIERCMKPEAQIYKIAIQRFGGDPATMLFVDDRADNVAAAQAAGFQAVIFKSADHLRKLLFGPDDKPDLTMAERHRQMA